MQKHLLPLLTTTTLLLLPNIVQAQIYTPSNRIPAADNSQIGTIVNPTGDNNFNIDGGLRRGQNLFHSFTDFSVPTGGAANFTNLAKNQSIITRVTGNVFSDINGLVNTNGANFLLINPYGVVFGPGVSLNVGKAFVTSTASGVDFVDAQGRNYNFGVNQAGDTLLKIDPDVAFNPAKLIMNASIPGSKGIENYGIIYTGNPNQYIGLIGGDVMINGGIIAAPGGRVELGGLQQNGEIGFNIDNGVQFPANVERGNVSLVSSGTSPSVIYVESSGGGNVGIFAKDITLKGKGTIIRAGIAAGLGSPTAIAGDIKLNATENINLSDGVFIYNQVNSTGVGKGGDIEIVTPNLSVTNGVQLSASTRGIGDAGNINITATGGNVSFDGSGVFTVVGIGANGKAGEIEIVTHDLSVKNRSQLVGRTGGIGDAGNINITASGNISFDGFSGAYSIVTPSANGKGGRIEIVTPILSLTNGAELVTSTYGAGNAGNIKITATGGKVSFDSGSVVASTVLPGANGKGGEIEIVTQDLSVTNIAQLLAGTKGKGDAGNIKITATGNVLFDGSKDTYASMAVSTVEKEGEGKGGAIEISAANLSVKNGAQLSASTQGKGDAGIIKITATGNVLFDGRKDGSSSLASSSVVSGAEGNGGGIEISAANLSITNGAGLVGSTEGKGDAGNIFLKSNTITLNKGKVLSKSTSSTGGDIKIVTTDFLLMQNNSLIATDSESTGKNGNGGNITISSPFIIALPGNNDITANANQGNGGKVSITSQGLFGIQYRPKGTDFTNDITASSTFGRSGSVQISTPGIDPAKDTGELPVAPNDASNQISQACGASQRENKFYITGRGGLPPNALEPQDSDALWEDARAVKATPATTAYLPPKYALPAIGWVFEQNGRVRLIAAQTTGGETGARVVCPVSSNK